MAMTLVTSNTALLSIEGISDKAATQGIMVEEKITMIGDYVMSHKGIRGFKRIGRTHKIGKWVLLYNLDSKEVEDDLLDDKLNTIFTNQILDCNKIPGYCAPYCSNAHLTTMTSYAKKLRDMLHDPNPMENLETFNKYPRT
eukprot:4417970-Ditylum_brightwellii.AAC.1